MKTGNISKIVLIIGSIFISLYASQWEVYTSKNDVRDIALAGDTLWAATTGGVVAWNLSNGSYSSYTIADGLLSCNINQVTIDKKGRPWVATIEPAGLFVYENQIWKQIAVGGDDYTIDGDIISDMEVDQFGNLWVYSSRFDHDEISFFTFNSDSVHVWRFDGQIWHKYQGVHGPFALDMQNNLLAVDSLREKDYSSNRYQFEVVSFNGSQFVSKFKFLDELHNLLYWIVLADIAQDSKGNLWFSYYDDRHGETFGVVSENTTYNTLDGLADDNVRCITPDETGGVWCATDGGISKFTGTEWVTYDTTDGVASNLVHKILIGADNTLYAATSNGISILKSNRFITLKTINEPVHNDYTDMAVDKNGNIVFAGGDHIAMYNDSQWKKNDIKNIRIREPYHLRENYGVFTKRKTFIKSDDGTLYAIGNEIKKNGSIIGHILKQAEDGNAFLKFYSHPLGEKYDRFLSPAIIGPSHDSCIWITNWKGNLFLLNNQSTKTFPSTKLAYNGWWVHSMMPDHKEKSLWIGTDHKGIFLFDGDSVKTTLSKKDGLVPGRITSIVRDSSDNLWFSAGESKSNHKGGISTMHGSKIRTYLKDADDKWFGSCNVLFVDNSGVVWAHCHNGIARFVGDSWKLFTSHTVSPSMPLPPYSHIIQDKSGTVWFGTEGWIDTKGCGLLAYKDNKWYQFTMSDGIPNNSIRNLVLDRNDNIWMLTDNGIAKCNPAELVHTRSQHIFKNKKNKQTIKQHGSRYFVSTKDRLKIIQYTLFDLRGRLILNQNIHNRKSFVLPHKYLSSGVFILSIILEDYSGVQYTHFMQLNECN